jgi:hypothetical protein
MPPFYRVRRGCSGRLSKGGGMPLFNGSCYQVWRGRDGQIKEGD